MMRINIENFVNKIRYKTIRFVLRELVGNLKELKNRFDAGDVAAVNEFFDLYVFNDSEESERPPMSKSLSLVLQERRRQDYKWGVQNHVDNDWLPILVEEVGEVSKCICEKNFTENPAHVIDRADEHLHEEITHVAAVALAWLEARDRRPKT